MAEPIRFVKEIGLYTFSRGRGTCRWKTQWCERHCYNRKFYRLYSKLGEVDAADDAYWQATSAEDFAKAIPRCRRFRFSVRGEIWPKRSDVLKVHRILEARPEVLFWIPTRGWVTMDTQEWIEDLILPLPNARVMASIDPTVSEYTEKALERRGWSTVFSGDNENRDQLLLDYSNRTKRKRTAGHYRCPKTWEHRTGHCAICADGCFSKERVDVHLKQHR